MLRPAVLVVLFLLLPSLHRLPAQTPPAVAAALAELDAIQAAERSQLEAELAKVGGRANCAPSEYSSIVIRAQRQAAAKLDELLQRTGDPAAKVEVFLRFLHYPDQRSARESLQDALAIAPTGRCRARVFAELAELVVTDEPERSLALLERAVAEDPTWAAPVLRRAWVAAWSAHYEAAFADLAEAERRDPAQNRELAIVRLRFLLLAGDDDRALECARAVRTAADAPPDVVVRAALLETLALLALDSRAEAALVLRPHLDKVDDHGSLFDFQRDARTAAFRELVRELQLAAERAAARRLVQQKVKEQAGQTPVEPLGIDEETDEERRAREAEETRRAELARARARALREASRPKPAWIDVLCTTCRGGGGATLECPHCNGRGTELYRTRKYTEREQQGANWVVRTREVPLPCHVCDGAGVVGGKCPQCSGKGVRSIPNPDK